MITDKIKHIIWDWNGTLFDDVDLCVEIMNNLLADEDKKPIDVDTYRDVFRFPVVEYYRSLGIGLTDKAFLEIGAQFIHQYEQKKYNCKLYHDAADIVSRFEQKGIQQSVLSAYSKHKLDEVLEHYNLVHKMHKVAGQNNIYAEGKIELGVKLFGELNLNTDEVILIGDTDHDFEVAKEMGINCILVSRGHQSKEKLLSTGAMLADSLSEIKF